MSNFARERRSVAGCDGPRLRVVTRQPRRRIARQRLGDFRLHGAATSCPNLCHPKSVSLEETAAIFRASGHGGSSSGIGTPVLAFEGSWALLSVRLLRADLAAEPLAGGLPGDAQGG